ncbi:21195_t:CDS:2 [Gigaspora margarita]|uniref:21195_t:CDS:1 n=1 Tax=Gigaspora margarita TaxID=4874 RepID=A0ABN7UKP7_GIGMA|nr:21195_t:CDS:2 [Gigaspora margarita]
MFFYRKSHVKIPVYNSLSSNQLIYKYITNIFEKNNCLKAETKLFKEENEKLKIKT